MIDPTMDLSPYKLLILGDDIPVDKDLQKKIQTFADNGGKVLMTGSSGLCKKDGFVFDIGAKWIGTSMNYGGDFVLPTDDLQASFVSDPLFMYQPAEKIQLQDGTSLGQVYEPYFQRTRTKFFGHVNAPSKPEPEKHVAGVQKGNFTYFAFPIFKCFQEVGALAVIEIIENLINKALGEDRIIKTNMPHGGRLTVRHQQTHNRDIVYLLYATPVARGQFRGKTIQPIHDLVPLHDTTVDMRVTSDVKSVKLIPCGTAVDYTQKGDSIHFTVDKFSICQMVEIQY